MEKSLFEKLGGTYYQEGDYQLPNLTLPEEQKLIGIFLGGWDSVTHDT